MSDCLDLFIESWGKGDLDGIMQAVSSDFVYDDPQVGRLAKSEFADYFASLIGSDEEREGERDESLNSMANCVTDQVTVERDGEEISWCWWFEPTTSQEGAALFKVGPDGVRLNRVAYYALK